MFNFFKFFVFFVFFFWSISLIDILNDYEIILNSYFVYIYFILFYFNYSLNSNTENINYNLNLDLIFKFFLLFLKIPNFMINYIFNIFRKIFLFLIYFKYKYFFNSLFIFFKKNLNPLFLIWRPLFKKSSYFGYYRSNRSKWIK